MKAQHLSKQVQCSIFSLEKYTSDADRMVMHKRPSPRSTFVQKYEKAVEGVNSGAG